MLSKFCVAYCLFITFFVLNSSSLADAEQFVRTQLLMGDVPVSIMIDASSRKKRPSNQAMEEAFEAARKIEREVSEWRKESQTSLLNREAGGMWVPIGNHLMEILIEAIRVSEMTEGAFDITWPSANRHARYSAVMVLPDFSLARLAKKGVKIGVSGIAKGYIVDRMSDVLRARGFGKYLINAGDIYAAGRWKVGIRNPKDPEGPPACEIVVRNQAVSTSGQYERGSHIIDPRNGKPVLREGSVTVIAPSSITADALATGLFVNPATIPKACREGPRCVTQTRQFQCLR